MKVERTVKVELIKARIDELQADVDSVKSELVSLKESTRGNFTADDVQAVDTLTRKLLTLKSGQAELINLIQP